MIDGGWALVICLSHGRAIWRDFLYCVRVFVYEELICGVPKLSYKSLLSYVLFVVRVWNYGISGMWL